WGDGTTADSLSSTTASDTHVYATTGNLKSEIFTITVSATNSAGPGSGKATEAVNDRPPTVTVNAPTPNPANIGMTVTITFTATDADGTVVSASVDWGDGSTPDSLPGSATSDSHSYSSIGTFIITVKATDNSGSIGSNTVSVSSAQTTEVR